MDNNRRKKEFIDVKQLYYLSLDNTRSNIKIVLAVYNDT